MKLEKNLWLEELSKAVLSEKIVNGVDQYIRVRRKEQRLLDDATVLTLPYLNKSHYLHDEWSKRAKSMERFLSWFQGKNHCRILDLGCGNGWFTYKLSRLEGVDVYGVDVNQIELTQATRLFKRENCQFLLADIFDERWPESYFDMIILNSSAQYFPDLDKLLRRLFRITKNGGEIHILDTPIYLRSDVEQARRSSQNYFRNIDHPEMIFFYFHHTWNIFQNYPHRLMYDPKSVINRLSAYFVNNVNPFPWICIFV